MNGVWSLAAPLLFAMAVSACTNTPQQPTTALPTPPTSQADGSDTVRAELQTLAAALPAPPPAEMDRPPLIQASLPGAAARPIARPQLMGLERSRVVEVLGRPRLARKEAAAEVLTFSGGECSLFVFLYDGPNGIGIVQHVEARSRQSLTAMSDSACLDNVMRRKALAADPA